MIGCAFALTIALLADTDPRHREPFTIGKSVEKGLKWLAAQQKSDGGWAGFNGVSRTSFTALAGIALLMEGSTPSHGRYAPHIRKAVSWMEENAQESGRISAKGEFETTVNMSNQADAILFLVCARDADDDDARRERTAKTIEGAIAFALRGQSARGGWGFGDIRDDSATTSKMLGALGAARRLGFAIPRRELDRATAYLINATAPDGGVLDASEDGAALARVVPRPHLTAGAAAALLPRTGPRPESFRAWLANLRTTGIPRGRDLHNLTGLNTQYNLARVSYSLGETGHRKLAPDAREDDLIRWSAYRERVFVPLCEIQTNEGFWPEPIIGSVYTTALALVILQLENDYLPAFAR